MEMNRRIRSGRKWPRTRPKKKANGRNQRPQPTPGEKKQRRSKAQSRANRKPTLPEARVPEAEPVEKEGEMSAAQANGLLNSLRSEEERVRLMQRQETEDTLKDW